MTNCLSRTIFVTIFLTFCVYYVAYGQRNLGKLDENIQRYDEIEEYLPKGNTYMPSGFNVRHPSDWTLSIVEVNRTLFLRRFSVWEEPDEYDLTERLYVFSPETVTFKTIEAYENGEITPPMFVVTSTFFEYVRGALLSYEVDLNAVAFADVDLLDIVDSYYQTFPRAVRLHILTTKEDWNENQNMYEAMLEFPQTYQYYAHEQLRQTYLWIDYYFGYPQDWMVELLDSHTGQEYLLTNNNDDLLDSIRIKVDKAPFQAIDIHENIKTDPKIEQFFSDYGIAADDYSLLFEAIQDSVCIITSMPLHFTKQSSNGVVKFYNDLLITISVDTDISTDEALLIEIMDSFYKIEPDGCG